MLDRGLARIGGPGDCHDVEPRGMIQQSVGLEIPQRGPRQPLLLIEVDRLGGMAGVGRAARFDFDKDDGAIVGRHQVELAQPRAAMPGQDVVTEPLQMAGGSVFAPLAQRLAAKPFGKPGSKGWK